MQPIAPRTVCWTPVWHPRFQGVGLELVVLGRGAAHSVLMAFDDEGRPFRLHYRLAWDAQARVHDLRLRVWQGDARRSLWLRSDGQGHWQQGHGPRLSALDGCSDVDIWPTPLTNSLPLWRSRLHPGERRIFRVAWVQAPALTVQPSLQAYTRLDDGRYRFESLDGSGFQADLRLDDDLLVLDYPGLFVRAGTWPAPQRTAVDGGGPLQAEAADGRSSQRSSRR